MNWQSAVERTVTGLGYDLVDAEKSAGGLLRVYIDHPAAALAADALGRFITVDDCERVTRQLQHVLEVDNVPYERLEVSSPGLDRPLRKEADYARFAGEQVELTLKVPFQGRKKYTGELSARDGGWRLLLVPAAAAKPAKAGKAAKAPSAGAGAGPSAVAIAAASGDQALDFLLEEVKEARLVPVVDFKGRPASQPADLKTAPDTDLRSVDEVEGDSIQ